MPETPWINHTAREAAWNNAFPRVLDDTKPARPIPDVVLTDPDAPPAPDGLAYTLQCRNCATRVRPQVYAARRADPTAGRAGGVDLVHECPHCWAELPQPPAMAHVRHEGDWIHLELNTTHTTISHCLHVNDLTQVRDPDRHIEQVWDSMAVALRWLGTN